MCPVAKVITAVQDVHLDDTAQSSNIAGTSTQDGSNTSDVVPMSGDTGAPAADNHTVDRWILTLVAMVRIWRPQHSLVRAFLPPRGRDRDDQMTRSLTPSHHHLPSQFVRPSPPFKSPPHYPHPLW